MATQKVSSCPERHLYDNNRTALNNDLLKNTDSDPTAIQHHLQSEYSQDYDHFMAGHPVCPDCGHRLYRHDTCNRSVKIQSAQTVVSLTIRRVHALIAAEPIVFCRFSSFPASRSAATPLLKSFSFTTVESQFQAVQRTG
ncbi:hypothetical protein [Allobaculum mucilyticum]|uniref:hypothetical protein n=1 Tax=Allobaculum mucilyticum TaxID=2834459 RepID=UPI001F6153C5|nr:hypothetical protein [Allobaculum mucilyticum]UNT95955.1 hypothetical protein KWG62_11800 [Allobaculum mucilyticum]